ncbi:FUSC family protein [Robbsia sp. Bb-Pol-6]|uniref:FUSC family protein n=1 Tax=Robbsia betulipollinis TaxID=2981849 RepID=A0ABT3ZPF5_9BURK|nr:FUSC family membrane protein [Robbsia betulipollinis]MCY0387828.1 FUSC family protein [Robbsia betulipollinis]
MRYSIELRKFLYSQHLFSGLRISLGIVLPAVVLLLGFDDRELGFTLASGAIAASVVDLPGPLKYKHNEMLACSFLGFLSALATGIATSSGFALWLTVVPLTFLLSMIVMFGAKGPQISFATLYMMITNLEQHFTPVEALVNALWLLGGSLWYTYWSYLISRWQIERIERQVIADAIFSTADYLRARARFYDPDTALADDYEDLVKKQIAAVEQQDAARDIVLRTLPRLKRSDGDPRRTRLFNLFINSVDLHDTAVSSHTDYVLLRNTFRDADLLVFFHDLLEKFANELETVGLAILQDRASVQHVRHKAELRAIEFEIDRMRRKDFPARDSEAYASTVATFRRMWTVSRLTERMHRNTRAATEGKLETEMRVDQALHGFLKSRRISLSQLLSNLTMSSPPFRHALRVTIAVAAGLGIGKLLPITNSYWIVLTTVIILKPGFSLTRERNTQRIVGTVIGCAASLAFLFVVKSTPVILGVVFACMFMAYSLLLINYAAAVVFISAYVLLLYHLLAPVGMRLIGERALDTVIGSSIAVAISYLFANWEYRLMGPLVKASIASMREYVDAIRAARPRAGAVPASAAPGGVSPGVAAGLDADYRYRLARKTVHVSYANLGQAFRRMMREPKSKQYYVAELNDLLVQSHALASQITAAAPMIAAVGSPEPPALRIALDAVRRNLAEAEAAASRAAAPTLPGVPAVGDTPDALRAMGKALDDMAVAVEKTQGVPADATHEIKLLVYQCKQMLRSSQLIRKDASAIHLLLEHDDAQAGADTGVAATAAAAAAGIAARAEADGAAARAADGATAFADDRADDGAGTSAGTGATGDAAAIKPEIEAEPDASRPTASARDAVESGASGPDGRSG